MQALELTPRFYLRWGSLREDVATVVSTLTG
jgi:hypothetical protein